MVKSLEYHPLADLIPLMQGEEFENLVEDIRDNGVQDPIMLLGGKILDGRNRYRALLTLSERKLPRGPGWGVYEGMPVEPVDIEPLPDLPWFKLYVTIEFGDPLRYVLSKNVHRRHLTTAQRALIAAGLERVGHGGDRSKSPIGELTLSDRAKHLKVGKRSVERAEKVIDHGSSELKESVRRGEMPISVASDLARLPKDEQRRVLREYTDSSERRHALKAITNGVKAEEQAQRVSQENTGKHFGMPAGRTYPFVLVDVPRKQDVDDASYPTLTFDELIDFQIDRFAASNAIVAYWSTATSILDDLEILGEWGFVAFRPRNEGGKLLRDNASKPLAPAAKGSCGSCEIWREVRAGEETGMGRSFRNDHKILLLARRGDVPEPLLPGTQAHSVLDTEVTDHATSPKEKVREWIDRCWPDMVKIQIFGRHQDRYGWTFWGGQAGTAADNDTPRRDEDCADGADTNSDAKPASASRSEGGELVDPETGEIIEPAGEDIAGGGENPGDDGTRRFPEKSIPLTKREATLPKDGQTRSTTANTSGRGGKGDEDKATDRRETPDDNPIVPGQCPDIPDFLRRTK